MIRVKVAVLTLGCKVNIYESEYIISKLKENNFDIVSFNDKADIYIINTCSVTNTSDKKSRKMIQKARMNKDAIVIAMGCHSQINDEIDADIIIGNKDKSKIIDLINEYLNTKKQIKKIYDLTNISFEDMEINSFENHTRAFVKIQDGCDAFCSYCIIPYTRGSIRSKPINNVINEITNLVKNGYKEIVLTGIHTGKYGKDINTNLESLLKEIIKIKNLYRVRISSIEINEVTDEIIKLIKDNKIIARHLHIPLQSGSDKILSLMNRKYDTKYYYEKIKKIRKEIKDISITTDLIVGFPEEDEQEFKNTISFLEKMRFTKIHTFPYSIRKNTKAALMKNQVDEKIKKQRVKEVIKISNKYEQEFENKYLNKKLSIITEQIKENTTVGYTSNYIKIIVNDILKENEIYDIIIEKIEKNNVYAKKV